MKLLQKSREFIKKMFGWCRNHKFLTVVIAVAVISAAGFVTWRRILFTPMQAQQEASYSFVRTTVLQKEGLEESVNATGSVESANTSTVSYSVQGSSAKIKTVNVAVGDTVKEGDIIVVLDTADIQESIAKEEEALAEKVEKAYTSYTKAQQDYDDAVEQYNSSVSAVSAAKKKRDTAKGEYEAAASSVSYFQTVYDTAVKAEQTALKEYNTALETARKTAQQTADTKKAELDSALAALQAAKDTLAATQEGADTTELQAAVTAAEAVVSAAQTEYSNALVEVDNSALKVSDTQYKAAQAATKEAQAALSNAKSSCGYDSYYSAYTQAQNSYEAAVSTRDQMADRVESAQEAVNTAYENYQDSQTSETLENLKEQLADCNLKAETDGKITSLNATVGGVANGTIAQIMDTDSLKVSITIGEADINSVEIGMKCKIRSDATDGEISGTLTQIDPVSSMGGSFGAEVTVDGEHTGLIIGMNADVDIIISETEDSFTVPIDAVGDDNDGLGSYIYRKTGGEGVDMEFEKVYVTTGESNDYYIEVYADSLQVGDVIRSYSDLTIGVEEVTGEEAQAALGIESLLGGITGGFNTGAMPGGDNLDGGREMPSGDRGMPTGDRDSGGNNGSGMPGGFGGGGQ